MSSSDIFVVISPGPALTKGDCIVSIGMSTRTSCPASCAAVAVAAASLAKGNTENVIGSFRASSEAVTALSPPNSFMTMVRRGALSVGGRMGKASVVASNQISCVSTPLVASVSLPAIR